MHKLDPEIRHLKDEINLVDSWLVPHYYNIRPVSPSIEMK